jgi:hypothetical protein
MMIDFLRQLYVHQSSYFAIDEIPSQGERTKDVTAEAVLSASYIKILSNRARDLDFIAIGKIKRVKSEVNTYTLTKKGYNFVKELNKLELGYGKFFTSIYDLQPVKNGQILLIRNKKNIEN